MAQVKNCSLSHVVVSLSPTGQLFLPALRLISPLLQTLSSLTPWSQHNRRERSAPLILRSSYQRSSCSNCSSRISPSIAPLQCRSLSLPRPPPHKAKVAAVAVDAAAEELASSSNRRTIQRAPEEHRDRGVVDRAEAVEVEEVAEDKIAAPASQRQTGFQRMPRALRKPSNLRKRKTTPMMGRFALFALRRSSITRCHHAITAPAIFAL